MLNRKHNDTTAKFEPDNNPLSLIFWLPDLFVENYRDWINQNVIQIQWFPFCKEYQVAFSLATLQCRHALWFQHLM